MPLRVLQSSRLLAFVVASGCLQCVILEPFEKTENSLFFFFFLLLLAREDGLTMSN